MARRIIALPPLSFVVISALTVATSVSAVADNMGVAQGAAAVDVCTTALVGSHATYNVGPGQRYLELDKVPFGALIAGDVVNIYARSTPYKSKIGLRAQGTVSAPVVINGVSDSDCKKPILDFDGATTARGTNPGGGRDIFGTIVEYNEALGGLIIKRGTGPNDRYGSYVPKFIIIQGLQLQGARTGAKFTTLAGATASYGSAGCLWVQQGQDIVIRNNIITDCGFGIFLMAKDDQLSEAAVRITIANNRVYGNGVPGSYLEHGFYVQAASPLVEGNFIGQNRRGSAGSSYKSRSSGEIFRRNYVLCSAACLDFVHAEEQAHGIAKQADYGTDYVYGNTIVSTGPPAIHYGGDNRGEQEQSEAKQFVPPIPYRKHLRFWDNDFTLVTNTYRDNVFRLSALETEVDAWGNTFNLNFTGAGDLSWVDVAGTLRLGPGNVINGRQPVNCGQNSFPQNCLVTIVTAIPADERLGLLQ